MWRNSILHCENLIKADWLTMMDIRLILAESESNMESDFQLWFY
jgi:hypothetical protein